MTNPNSKQGNVVALGAAIENLTSIVTFASASGIPVEEVVEWVENGTIPSARFADFIMVDVGKLRADLLSGKKEFKEGDYDHE
ncbi:hypothetical protein VUJ49_07020 [Pseudomonas berkeleyensis]|uniref:Uncharacterized protein n=1 Tax=Pseudomonas berkeleyensis TaxID=2726956 RepID=A0A7G5DSS7_9PSED|nr:hypothetical protein [Pseudomonas berkeleyensis]QMV64802.1 hypothetical protein HS968_06990 [Pseudomonas berkeleyensis]WSO40272.1 hypothetical protein VUJ49_07020 [Pseudomonas berkeleyensis]